MLYCNIKVQGDIYPSRYHFHEEERVAHWDMIMGRFMFVFSLSPA